MKNKSLFSIIALFCFFANLTAQVTFLDNGDTIDIKKGQISSTKFWLHHLAKEWHMEQIGPFIRLNKNMIGTIDSLHFLTSTNNGKTWKATSIFSDTISFSIRPERALIKTKKGTLILAFANDRERAKWKWDKNTHDSPEAELPTYLVSSNDNGRSWNQPILLHREWTGAVRDIIETKDGHIVFSTMMMRHNPGHHAVVTYTSGDEGKTWTRSNILDLGGVGDHDGVTESTLEQMQNGQLKMLLRTNWGFFWETTSADNGISWTNIKSTQIDASSSPGLLKRLKSGHLMLVWNRYYPSGRSSYPLRGGDYNFSATPVSMHREELSIMFSSDDGRSWTKPMVIAKTTEPKTQIAYPYMFEIKPGVIGLSFAFSKVRMIIHEKSFIK